MILTLVPQSMWFFKSYHCVNTLPWVNKGCPSMGIMPREGVVDTWVGPHWAFCIKGSASHLTSGASAERAPISIQLLCWNWSEEAVQVPRRLCLVLDKVLWELSLWVGELLLQFRGAAMTLVPGMCGTQPKARGLESFQECTAWDQGGRQTKYRPSVLHLPSL